MHSLALSVYITQAINVLVVLFGFLYLAQRIRRLRRLSYSNRSIHMYPAFRWTFVILFLLTNLAELILFFILDLRTNHWLQQLLHCIGTFLNALILLLGLLLLRLQISKDRKRTHLHIVYSLYLIIITAIRLTQEILSSIDNHTGTFNSEIITDALLLILVIVMLIHKMKNNNFQDYLGQEVGIGELQERLRKGSMTAFQEEIESDDTFPYIKVDVVSLTTSEISFAVFLKQKPFVIKSITIEELHNFHIKTQVLDLQTRLNIQKQLNVNDIQNFVDELLSYWQNYQGFVLDFFGIPVQMHQEWSTKISKFKQGNSIQQLFDPNSIYFSLSVNKFIRYQNSFQALIQISTRSGKFRKQINKTLKQIRSLHQKLASITIKTRKQTFKLILPPLPQVTYIINDDQQIKEEKIKYQKYLQKVVNDRNIVKRHKQARIVVYGFLQYPQAIQMSLRKESNINYSGLRSRPVRITTKLNQKNQPAIMYYFEILQHDVHFKKIRKLYKEFVELNQQIKRYLHNSQTQKFVEVPNLPEKPRNYFSQQGKEQMLLSLNDYLNVLLCTFPDLSEIYQFKVFLNIKGEQQESEGSFFQYPQTLKKVSEFSLQKSNSCDQLLQQQIDNLGGFQFDIDIK